MVPATLTPTGAPRVFTRGRLSPASTATPMVLMPMMATSMWRGTRMTVTVMATTREKLSPATPLLLLTTPLVDTATTSTVPATPTLIGLPRVFTRGPPTATPLPSLTTPLEAMATTSTVPATLTPTGAPRGFTRGRLSPASTAIPMMATSMWRGTRMTVTVMATTRGRLSPATPLLSLTTPLEDTATTSTVPATPTLIGLPRVFTRGQATATTSTVPATLTPTGAPRVFTRGRLSPASTAI